MTARFDRSPLYIECYNLRERMALTNTNVLVPIVMLIDAGGDATENPGDATMLICGASGYGWFYCNRQEYIEAIPQ